MCECANARVCDWGEQLQHMLLYYTDVFAQHPVFVATIADGREALASYMLALL